MPFCQPSIDQSFINQRFCFVAETLMVFSTLGLVGDSRGVCTQKCC